MPGCGFGTHSGLGRHECECRYVAAVVVLMRKPGMDVVAYCVLTDPMYHHRRGVAAEIFHDTVY